jgi:hypothetical protein
MSDLATHTSWQLAHLAECSDPDEHDGLGFEDSTRRVGSPGAEFLRGVEDSVKEAVTDGWWDEDSAHEIADSAVPIYTHRMWQTFVDLAAYQEDPSELGDYSDDPNRMAGVCLYMIADRLARALGEEYTDVADADDDES